MVSISNSMYPPSKLKDVFPCTPPEPVIVHPLSFHCTLPSAVMSLSIGQYNSADTTTPERAYTFHISTKRRRNSQRYFSKNVNQTAVTRHASSIPEESIHVSQHAETIEGPRLRLCENAAFQVSPPKRSRLTSSQLLTSGTIRNLMSSATR